MRGHRTATGSHGATLADLSRTAERQIAGRARNAWNSDLAQRRTSTDDVDRLLVLVRHGQSEWNLKNLFTGWHDRDLTEKGVEEARDAGRKLKAQGFTFDIAYTSALKRAQRTLDLILEEMGQPNLPIIRDQALNERDYGDLVRPQQGRCAARNGARSRCISGGAPMTSRRPVARA